jgi:hypothetical protein
VARELGPLPLHPLDELIHQRCDIFAARGHARFGRCAVDRALQRDLRGGARFDAAGFEAFFPEDDPEMVEAAWKQYDVIRSIRDSNA